MKNTILPLLLISFCLIMKTTAQETKHIVYLIPGQGADYRLFNNLSLDDSYEVRHVHYELPAANMTLPDYARQMAKQIDDSQPFSIIGTSLGGMIAIEMCDFLQPEKVIVIASAKTHKELPPQYRFQKKIPIYKLVSGKVSKWGALLLQPIFEPDRNREKETFVQMLKDKDPRFFRRTIEMIINWERHHYREDIIHIHGEKDHTIPVKNVKYDYLIPQGSHVMTLTRGKELSILLNELLLKEG